MKHLIRAGLVVCALAIPASVSAQSGLTVHGYLTQGYAEATDIPIYGIGTDGTTDYRAMALQFRYGMNADQALVFQLSHRRLGTSAIQETEPDVALDWAFFQQRWKGNNIRIGKVPFPRGLFNEIRDVGVLLPFFRASKAVYTEGVETIDGISFGRGMDLGDSGFRLDATAFGGEYVTKLEFVDTDGLGVINSRVSNVWGIHGFLDTPITGFRLTGMVNDGEYSGGEGISSYFLGFDYSVDRFFARGEQIVADVENSSGGEGTKYEAWYLQGGFGLTDKLWVNGQYEANDITAFQALPSPPFPSPVLEYENIRDAALGLSYRFSPFLVLKGEYHWFEGFQLDDPTKAVPLNPMTGQKLPGNETNYFIISLSAAF